MSAISKRLIKNIVENIEADYSWLSNQLIQDAIRSELRGARCVLAFDASTYRDVEPVICLVLKGQEEPEQTFRINNKTAFRLSAPRDEHERDAMAKGIRKLISDLQMKLAKLEADAAG